MAKSEPLKGARGESARPRQEPEALADKLAEAGWVEADLALAQALLDLVDLERSAATAARKLTRAGASQLDAAVLLVRQSVLAAARRRGLACFGVIDAEADFDPRAHALEAPPRATPARVKILAPGVQRGREAVIKARVAAVTSRRRAR